MQDNTNIHQPVQKNQGISLVKNPSGFTFMIFVVSLKLFFENGGYGFCAFGWPQLLIFHKCPHDPPNWLLQTQDDSSDSESTLIAAEPRKFPKQGGGGYCR